MKLYNFLKEYGLKANDIKNRLNNKQIIVNGNVEDGDLKLGNIKSVYEQGFFMSKLSKMSFYEKFYDQLLFLGLENLIGETNIKNELTEFLSNFNMIQISKDTIIFIELNKSKTENITWKLEGKNVFTKKVEDNKELDKTDLINKTISDIDKVNKQLSNKGFIENAPKFKVENAQNRLVRLEKKLYELMN